MTPATTLKEKIRAIQNLEDALNKPRTDLNEAQRIERKQFIRQLLGIENNFDSSQLSFDIEKFENIASKFFGKIGMVKPYKNIEIRPLPKDMFIKFDEETLVLEEAFIKTRSPELVVIIAIHEMYHKYGQNLNPDMVQVKYFTDFFGQQTIIEMDIDADVETFQFLMEHADLDFNQYLDLIYTATKNASPRASNYSTPRIPKTVRSIGSLLSIYASQKSGSKNIFVPNLHEVEGGNHYVACISNGRKFAKIPSVKKLINIFFTLTDLSKEDFIDSVYECCEEIYISISTQLKLTTI